MHLFQLFIFLFGNVIAFVYHTYEEAASHKLNILEIKTRGENRASCTVRGGEEEGSASYTVVWLKSINTGFSVLMEFLAEAPKRCQMGTFLPFICLGFSTSSCRGPRAVYVVLDCK